MGDTNRDPELDRAKPDPRSDLECVTGASSEAAEAVDGATTTPLEPTGAPDGVAGTAGETKNQDKTAQ